MDSRTIRLSARERAMLRSACTELTGGGSTQAIQSIAALGDAASDWARDLRASLADDGDRVTLSEADWRRVYDLNHAVIYGLGSNELETCTGHEVEAWLNLNLKICAALWGAYPGGAW